MTDQGLTYCRPEMKGKPLQGRTSKRYCPVCKLKIRGSNHKEGQHHKRVENHNA